MLNSSILKSTMTDQPEVNWPDHTNVFSGSSAFDQTRSTDMQGGRIKMRGNDEGWNKLPARWLRSSHCPVNSSESVKVE